NEAGQRLGIPACEVRLKDGIRVLLLLRFQTGRRVGAKRVDGAPSLQEVINKYPSLWRCQSGRLKQQMERCRRRLIVEENALQASSRNIGINLPGRHSQYSGALFRCRYEGVKAIHPEPTGYADSPFRLRSLLETPLGCPGRVREHQTVVPAEIGWYLGGPAALQIGARSADDHPELGELARDQLRIRQVSDPKRELNIFFDHIAGTVDEQKLDDKRMVAAQEFSKQWCNQ